MRITFEFNLDADYDYYKDNYSEDVDEIVEKLGAYYATEYDDVEEAERAWYYACKSYSRGDSAHHISNVRVDDVLVDIDDVFSGFDFKDVLGAAEDANSKGFKDASICDYVNAKRQSEKMKREAEMEASRDDLIAQVKQRIVLKEYVCEECGEWLSPDDETGVEMVKQKSPTNGIAAKTYICHSCGHAGRLELNVSLR